MYCVPMSMSNKWSTCLTELKDQFFPFNAMDLAKCKWEELSLNKGECVTEFYERFRRLHLKLDLHQLMPTKMLADVYGYMIEQGIQGV
jgi:hypothetical protein